MLTRMAVHGFRTLIDTEVHFDPMTIMIGKNGAGKTSILDSLQIIGNFARGGVARAFGPPPWSLGWQRSKGIGQVNAVRFECDVRLLDNRTYRYHLSLNEHIGNTQVVEERLMRLPHHTIVASYDFANPPASGSILNPPKGANCFDEIQAVSNVFRSVVSYELNPSSIEQGNDPALTHVGKDGFGVAAFLGNLNDTRPDDFVVIEDCIKQFRPETEAIEVWAAGSTLFWGLRSAGQQRAVPALHLSWGDRQLVGLICVLFQNSREGGHTIAIEEIDRGFHPSRYNGVIELLSQAAYDGCFLGEKLQLIVTTHSPSFISKLGDRSNEIRMVSREAGGATLVRSMDRVIHDTFGEGGLEQSLGEVWEMDLLEDLVHQGMN